MRCCARCASFVALQPHVGYMCGEVRVHLVADIDGQQRCLMERYVDDDSSTGAPRCVRVIDVSKVTGFLANRFIHRGASHVCEDEQRGRSMGSLRFTSSGPTACATAAVLAKEAARRLVE